MKRRTYTKDFKENAVQLAIKLGLSKAAKQLAIPIATLNNWLNVHHNLMETNKNHSEDMHNTILKSSEIHTVEKKTTESKEKNSTETIFDIEKSEYHAISLTDQTEDFYDELCTDGNIERYFFVDYENVNRDGLTGILALDKNDCVRIYYSDKCSTLSFGLHRKIMETSAKIEYTKVLLPIKNAADCQILFEIKESFKIHKNTDYFIISKDSDFDRPVDIYRSMGIKVKKIHKISDYVSFDGVDNGLSIKEKSQISEEETERSKIFRQKYEENFNEGVFLEKEEEILSILLKTPNRQEMNQKLCRILSGDKVSKILKYFKAMINDIPYK